MPLALNFFGIVKVQPNATTPTLGALRSQSLAP